MINAAQPYCLPPTLAPQKSPKKKEAKKGGGVGVENASDGWVSVDVRGPALSAGRLTWRSGVCPPTETGGQRPVPPDGGILEERLSFRSLRTTLSFQGALSERGLWARVGTCGHLSWQLGLSQLAHQGGLAIWDTAGCCWKPCQSLVRSLSVGFGQGPYVPRGRSLGGRGLAWLHL